MIVQEICLSASASSAKAVLDVAGWINASRDSVRVERPLPAWPIRSICVWKGTKADHEPGICPLPIMSGESPLRSPERRCGAGKKTTVRNIVKNFCMLGWLPAIPKSHPEKSMT
jgi:hypothetical protein